MYIDPLDQPIPTTESQTPEQAADALRAELQGYKNWMIWLFFGNFILASIWVVLGQGLGDLLWRLLLLFQFYFLGGTLLMLLLSYTVGLFIAFLPYKDFSLMQRYRRTAILVGLGIQFVITVVLLAGCFCQLVFNLSEFL